jgi:hypothetical protein
MKDGVVKIEHDRHLRSGCLSLEPRRPKQRRFAKKIDKIVPSEIAKLAAPAFQVSRDGADLSEDIAASVKHLTQLLGLEGRICDLNAMLAEYRLPLLDTETLAW